MNEEKKVITKKHLKLWRILSWIGLVVGLLLASGAIFYYLSTDFTYWSAGAQVPLGILSFICIPILILSATGFISTSKKYLNRKILQPNLEKRREHSLIGLGVGLILGFGGIIYLIDVQLRDGNSFATLMSMALSFILFVICAPILLLSTIGFVTTRNRN